MFKKLKKKTEEVAKKTVDAGKKVGEKGVEVGKDVGRKGVKAGKKVGKEGIELGKKGVKKTKKAIEEAWPNHNRFSEKCVRTHQAKRHQTVSQTQSLCKVYG